HDSATDVLLKNRADPRRGDVNRMSPLHIAAIYDHVSVAARLLAAGAPVDAKNRGGCTPLHMAALNNRREMIVLLLNRGANVEAVNTFGGSRIVSGDRFTRCDRRTHLAWRQPAPP